MWNVGRPSGQQLMKEELMSESWVRITSSVWLGVCLFLYFSLQLCAHPFPWSNFASTHLLKVLSQGDIKNIIVPVPEPGMT